MHFVAIDRELNRAAAKGRVGAIRRPQPAKTETGAHFLMHFGRVCAHSAGERSGLRHLGCTRLRATKAARLRRSGLRNWPR